MARVTLDLPEQFFYITNITVGANDINAGGHVGNDQMIMLLSVARNRFFDSLTINPIDLGDITMVAADLAATYRRESFLRDVLQFELGFMDFNKYGVDMMFRVSKAGGELVVLAKTGFVFINKKTKKVAAMPSLFINSIPLKYRP
jgi:acyl-CoA thioesterase FadM